jgi:hypothetical protein
VIGKFFKVVGIVIMVFIIVSVVISMVGGEDGATDTGTTKREIKKEDLTIEQVEGKSVNQENFDKIIQGDSLTGEGGMTIEEAKAVLGEPDSETESQSGDMTMKVFTWTNLKFESISVTFINDKVSSKTYLK